MRKSIIKLLRKNFLLFFKLQAADWLKTHINLKQSYKLSKRKISLTRTSYVSLSLNSLRIQQCPADSPQMMDENHAGLVETTIGESNDATALTPLERWKSTLIHFYQIHPLHPLGQKLMKNVLNFHPEVQHHTPGSPYNPPNNPPGEKPQLQLHLVAALPAPTAKDNQNGQIAAYDTTTTVTIGPPKTKTGPLINPPAPPDLTAVNDLMRTVIEGDLPVKREISTLTIDKGATLITIEITVETETDLFNKNDMIDLETIIDLEQNIARNVIEKTTESVIEKTTETIGPLIIETIAIIVAIETENTIGTAREALVVTVSRTITRRILLLKIDQGLETDLIEVRRAKAEMNHRQDTDLLLLAQKMFMSQ
jgi:hypothetical protein